MNGSRLLAHPLRDIIAHARGHVPFYRRLYEGLEENPSLEKLPVTEPDDFWKAHARDRREILADDLLPALVVNSGGTTGAPKHSYFTAEESDSTIALAARGYANSGVREGDRVANLFAGGDLHASFPMVFGALRLGCPGALQLPLGNAVPMENLVGSLKLFAVNVLAGFPTPLLRLIEKLDPATDGIRLERILFAGEMFSEDQRLHLERKYPGIVIRSAGYGSVDAGVVGYADADCGPGEHRPFGDAMILEIVDEETGRVIEQPGVPGRLLATNLTRRLMPNIRYSLGDLAQWVEPPGPPSRRFALLGRTQQSVRVVFIDLPVAKVRALLAPFAEELGITQFQILAAREERLDRLTLRIVAGAPAACLEAARPRILQKLLESDPEWSYLLGERLMHPFSLDWISLGELIVNERTGKWRPVVDRRVG